MTSKEIVKNTITFKRPERVARSTPPEYGDDFKIINMIPSVDYRPQEKGRHPDEWGAIWENIGICHLGEVKEYPLLDWNDWHKLKVPEVDAQHRWKSVRIPGKPPAHGRENNGPRPATAWSRS